MLRKSYFSDFSYFSDLSYFSDFPYFRTFSSKISNVWTGNKVEEHFSNFELKKLKVERQGENEQQRGNSLIKYLTKKGKKNFSTFSKGQ